MKTIVVGYDGSETAERALARGAELAEALAARLVVVAVAEPPWVPVPMPIPEAETVFVPSPAAASPPAGEALPLPGVEPGPAPEPKELAQGRLEQARRALAGRRLEAEYVPDVGAPADRLLAVANECDADLIVVGSREHGLLERLLAPPVEQTVARRAGRDVLLVH